MCTSLNEEGFTQKSYVASWEFVIEFVELFFQSFIASTTFLIPGGHIRAPPGLYVNNFYLIFSSLFRSLSDKCVRSQKENHHLCLSRHQLLLASRYRFLLLHDYCSNCSGLVILSTKWVFEYMSIQQLLRKLVLNLSLGFTDLPQNTDRIVFLMNQNVLLLAYYH